MKLHQLLFFVLFPGCVFSQLSGRIINQNSNGIPYASVSIKNTAIGVVTDSVGQFLLPVVERYPFTLQISSAGFQPSEFVVRNESINNILIELNALYYRDTIIITSRRRRELLQDVPIPVSVVTGSFIDDAGAFNVNRLKELFPSVQLYSSNPRNTALNIRGQGTTFGLTNDGIEPGVGFYVDGVYYARPAAAMLDFVDVERIEVARGPQGTLFGKNTTAGTFNITTRKPSFKPTAVLEASYGNFGFIQAKASISGALNKKLAGRISFSGTQRDGTIENVITRRFINDMNNIGFRGQLLLKPRENIEVVLAIDANKQRPEGYGQIVAGVVQTLRPDYRQFENIIADLGYVLPNKNAFDRKVDHNTVWRSGNDLGGASLNVDIKLGPGTLTSTTAYRYWKWDPSNDRDFTGLAVLSLSQAPSRHKQWSQEIRYSGDVAKNLTGVFGVFVIGQDLRTDPYHTEESGSAQWRFSQSTTSPKWNTPGLFDGYGIRTISTLNSLSSAAFSQLDLEIANRFHLLAGLRFNYDQKKVDFDRQTYGGLETNDPELIALKRAVYTDQAFDTDTKNTNLSGQLTFSFRPNRNLNSFATFSTSYKSIGLNLGGLPTANGLVMIELATIRPEYVKHFEIGVKTTPRPGTILNVTIYNTDIRDYQTQVQTAEVGVNRGYLANAKKVRIRGIEIDGNSKINSQFQFFGAIAVTEGKYVSFQNAPVPLEETGATSAFKDISGGKLPGISKTSITLGGEYTRPAVFFGRNAKFFIAIDGYYRSDFSSSPSPSKYLNVEGYTLLNGRIGYRVTNGLSLFAWGRNLLNKNYFEQLLPAAGNAGHYVGVLGDVRMYGVTIRYSL